jgi:hypothetical protein
VDTFIINALAAAGGPVGILLGVAIWFLWLRIAKLEETITSERAHYEGVLASERSRYEARIEALHEEQKQLLGRVNDSLADLLGEE